MPNLFDIIFLLYSLLYFPYLMITKRWHEDYGQRFGFFSDKVKDSFSKRRNIWVHAVSVGEVLAVEGLIRRLKTQWPQYTIVFSVTTKTGYELAQKKFGDQVCVIASPLDFSWVAAVFVRLIKPKIYIIAETEIWPNLYHRLYNNNVPIVIINGRISDRSFGRYRLIKGLLKPILNLVSLFCMQSDLDAGRIKELGSSADKVVNVGNIKFDDVISEEAVSEYDLPKPLWIAGSTHLGEEKIVLDVFKKLPKDWHLIIAPRHVERTGEIISFVEDAGFKAVKFSERRSSSDTNAVIVVDTIGLLRQLYASADLVFVGKSLCVGGGHNVIEPAIYAKPIVIGSMMENFRDITACFKADQGLVQVESVQAFEEAIIRLAADEEERKALGARARKVVLRNQGALERTLERIKPWL